MLNIYTIEINSLLAGPPGPEEVDFFMKTENIALSKLSEPGSSLEHPSGWQ
jgi:hypothetical protein